MTILCTFEDLGNVTNVKYFLFRTLSRRNMGADGPPLGEIGERLFEQKRRFRHLEDPRHLRLHQVRSPPQHHHPSARAGKHGE
jgi:hypothetical protein